MAVLDVRFDIFLVRFDISRPIRHSVLPALLSVPPIYRDVTENARGSNKHRRRFPSGRAGI